MAGEDDLQSFLGAFAILLVKHDLQDVLGLRAVPLQEVVGRGALSSAHFAGWTELAQEAVALRFAPEEVSSLSRCDSGFWAPILTPDRQTADWEDEAEDCACFVHEQYVRNERNCRRHVALSKRRLLRCTVPRFELTRNTASEPGPAQSDSPDRSTTPRPGRSEGIASREQAEPEPELWSREGYIPTIEDPEDFHATLRKFLNTMVVEDIEVMGDGTVRFHGRSAEMPQRPKSR